MSWPTLTLGLQNLWASPGLSLFTYFKIYARRKLTPPQTSTQLMNKGINFFSMGIDLKILLHQSGKRFFLLYGPPIPVEDIGSILAHKTDSQLVLALGLSPTSYNGMITHLISQFQYVPVIITQAL